MGRFQLLTIPPENVDEAPYATICINRNWIPILLSLIERLEWRATYEAGVDYDRAEANAYTLGMLLANSLEGDAPCGDGVADECNDYSLMSGIVDIQPQNPFTEPDYTPPGYVSPPFTIVKPTDTLLILLGFQVGDMITDITRFPSGSLPTIIPPDGFARFRVTFEGPAELLVELLQIEFGGMVSLQLDDDPFTAQVSDLTLDGAAVPAETDRTVIQSVRVDTPGTHHVDISFLPKADDAIPFIGYGGGVRKITICAEQPIGSTMPEFRLNGEHLEWRPAVGTGSWIDLGDIVPKPIITTERDGNELDILFALETNPTATTVIGTVYDGVDGDDGAPGEPGEDGEDGECPDCDDEITEAEKCRIAGYVGYRVFEALNYALVAYENLVAENEAEISPNFNTVLNNFGEKLLEGTGIAMGWLNYDDALFELQQHTYNWEEWYNESEAYVDFDAWQIALYFVVLQDSDWLMKWRCALLYSLTGAYWSFTIPTTWTDFMGLDLPDPAFSAVYKTFIAHVGSAVWAQLFAMATFSDATFNCAVCVPPAVTSIRFQTETSSADEGTSHEIIVVLNTLAPLTEDLHFQLVPTGGTATEGDDYDLSIGGMFLAGSGNGATTDAHITLHGDSESEDDETAIFTLEVIGGGASIGEPGTHTVTINDAGDDVWCYKSDFDSTVDVWSFFNSGTCTGGSIQSAYLESVPCYVAPATYNVLNIRQTFSARVVTFAEALFDYGRGDFSNYPPNGVQNVKMRLYLGATMVGEVTYGNGTNATGVYLQYTGGVLCDRIELTGLMCDRVTGSNNGYLRLYHMLLQGTGENPIGEDNCE